MSKSLYDIIDIPIFLLLDIPECEKNNTCDGNATCSNTDGSHTCACNTGYSGDGYSCTGGFVSNKDNT